MDKKLTWLKQLSETCGVSGFETPIKNLLQKRLQGKAKVSYDKLGSAVFTNEGQGKDLPKIMLASHMDEIGFMVKHITKEGFLKFICLGGWWEQVMLSQRVTVHGSKGDLVGVIGSKPPHILTPEERTKVVAKRDMYIDIGAADEDMARNLGVFEGCPVTPYAEFAVMGDRFSILEKKTKNTRARRRNRYITINTAVVEAVTLYLENTPGVRLSDYMFRSESNNGANLNKPIHRASVDTMLKGIARDLGLGNRMSTHTLRKTFAYHQMVMSGNDPRKLLLLQKMFGHSTAAQTLDYIGITSEEIDEAYRNLNLGSVTCNYLVDSNLMESDPVTA